MVESVSLSTKVAKNKHINRRPIVDMNLSHNDSLMNRSFLPSMQERNLSRIKNRDDKAVKQSRNIGKDFFKGQNTSSYLGKSRLSTQSKSAIKSSTKFVKRLRTSDINLGSNVNESAVILEGTPDMTKSRYDTLKYRDTEIR